MKRTQNDGKSQQRNQDVYADSCDKIQVSVKGRKGVNVTRGREEKGFYRSVKDEEGVNL